MPKGSILASSFHAVDLDDLFAVLNDPVPKHVKTNLHSIEDLSYMFDAISGQIDAVKKNVQKATKDRNAVAAMGNKFAKFVVKVFNSCCSCSPFSLTVLRPSLSK